MNSKKESQRLNQVGRYFEKNYIGEFGLATLATLRISCICPLVTFVPTCTHLQTRFFDVSFIKSQRCLLVITVYIQYFTGIVINMKRKIPISSSVVPVCIYNIRTKSLQLIF